MFWWKLCKSNGNCAWNLAFISCNYLTYCMKYGWKSSLWIGGIFQRATQRARILLTDNIQNGGSCSVGCYQNEERTRNGNRGKWMRNREEIGKQHREWVITLLIGLRLGPVFHFLISVFVPCSLFLVLVMSILACGHGRISGRRFSPPGWRDRKYVCVRSSG